MSLNDEATDDLDNTIVDDDIVHSSPVVPVQDKTTTIIVDERAKPIESTPLTEEQVKAITDTNVQFNLIEDNVSKVVDLQDIEKEFLAQESIDRHMAEYLDSQFQGLLGTKISIEEYTRIPSRTNLDLTRRHVKLSIAHEEAQVVDTFNSFTIKSLHDTGEVLKVLKEKYLYDFSNQVRQLAKLSENVIANVSQSKNTIVPYQNGEHIEFVDIADLDLVKLDFANLKLEAPSIDQLSCYKANIASILTNSNIKTLITLVIDSGRVSYPVDHEVINLAMTRPISLLTLAKFFNNKALIEFVDSFDSTLSDCLTTIEQVKQDVTTLDSFDKLRAYLIEHSMDIHTAIHQAMQLVCHVNNVSMMALNVKTLFEYLSNLAKT